MAIQTNGDTISCDGQQFVMEVTDDNQQATVAMVNRSQNSMVECNEGVTIEAPSGVKIVNGATPFNAAIIQYGGIVVPVQVAAPTTNDIVVGAVKHYKVGGKLRLYYHNPDTNAIEVVV